MLGFFAVALWSDDGVGNGTGGFLGLGGLSLSGIQHSWQQIISYGGSDTPHVYLTWIGNTLFVATAGGVLALLAALPTGYVLALLRFRGKKLVLIITLLAMVMPKWLIHFTAGAGVVS